MAEVELLVEICRLGETDGVITFAPLHHLYGFLVSFLIPAVRGQRVWFWPMDRVGPLTFAGIARPLVAAIPSAMVLLDRGAEGLRAYRSVTVVHSTAMLPPAGRSLLESSRGANYA
jgi:hypothetical protein